VEFLGLPAAHAETDPHRGLLEKLKDFLIELGRDFCFVGSEYPLQVGDRNFALDLLSKRSTGMFAKLTSSRPSVCCSSRARMMK
jgi:predicted nuclease of restriction endonuclease-like (RecB) superfamily